MIKDLQNQIPSIQLINECVKIVRKVLPDKLTVE